VTVRWFKRVKTASRPPAYLVERSKDLEYASKVAFRSPRVARGILLELATKFDDHMDHDYAQETRGAAEVVLDSAARAGAIISAMIGRMEAEKDDMDQED
jgi:hypothetical protein